ncbi:hypothetical protein PAXINDRAFT_8568 [Paxillus involutus ATCC 200175]|nr:hypothetical protein PAXINDRAFT_8568 [Paxillus involutus ATCC 200175]
MGGISGSQQTYDTTISICNNASHRVYIAALVIEVEKGSLGVEVTMLNGKAALLQGGARKWDIGGCPEGRDLDGMEAPQAYTFPPLQEKDVVDLRTRHLAVLLDR